MAKVQTYKTSPTKLAKFWYFFGWKMRVRSIWVHAKYHQEKDCIQKTTRCLSRLGFAVFEDRTDLVQPPPINPNDVDPTTVARQKYMEYKEQLKKSGKTEKFLLVYR